MNKLKILFLSLASILILFSSNSCKKTNDGPNDLGGDVTIPLTAVDSVTTVYIKLNGQSVSGSASIKVISNQNGLVTYGGSFDLSTTPDSVRTELMNIVPALISYYKPKDVSISFGPANVIQYQVKVKVTSEGIQSYFVDGKPWTVKYGDGQGTEYKLTRDNGDVLKATVTEKTGMDDWPFGFLSIKTSKVEYNAPATDTIIKKVTYRVNHKFGLVYINLEGRNGKKLQFDLFAFHVL